MDKSFFLKKILPIILVCVLAVSGVALFFVFKNLNKTKNGIKLTNISLYENGVSHYKILIPSTPTTHETTAANELQTIFYKSTGYTLTIEKEKNTYSTKDNIISIGNTNLFNTTDINITEIDFNYDGFLIKRLDNTIIINANADVGKIHGAHRFCELNMDYIYYAKDCVKYVKTNNLKLLDFNLIDIPDFQGRISYTYEMLHDENNLINLYGSLSSNAASIKKYPSFWSSLHDQSITHQIVPLETYYADHNDWYYIKPGANINDLYSSDRNIRLEFLRTNTQICYTKALSSKGQTGGLYETFLNNLINEFIAKETTKTMFMLGMSDNTLVCDCSNCTTSNTQYTVTGTCMRFINAIARDVENWRLQNCPEREINLVVFAYGSTEKAPVKLIDDIYQSSDTSVIAEKNVIVRIAPLYSCHYYPFNDKEHNATIANTFEQWQLCAQKFAIWDYNLYIHNQVAVLPSWNSVPNNLKYYKEIGVIDILAQSEPNIANFEFVELNNYVRSRLMWNVNLDYMTLAYDFIENYYGEASFAIKEYFDLLIHHYENHIMKRKANMVIYSSIMSPVYWPLTTLMQMQGIFTKAYNSIQNCSATRKAMLKSRIDQESAFYRYALIDIFGTQAYTTQQLKTAIDDYYAIKNSINAEPYNKVNIETTIQNWKDKYNLT